VKTVTKLSGKRGMLGFLAEIQDLVDPKGLIVVARLDVLRRGIGILKGLFE
jgi:hypothetical protein